MPDPNIRQTRASRGPVSSPVRDLKNVRRNVSATAGELKEFMGRLRGKSAREMLGVVASSSLIQSVITASVAIGILIVALTVVPYTWGMFFGPDKEVVDKSAEGGAGPADASGAGETDSPGDTPPAAGSTSEPVPPATAGEPSTPPEGAADILGIGESKPAPPGTNPLEGSVDDLFDDVK